MIFYKLMTLDAAAMLDNMVTCQQDTMNSFCPEIVFDFNERTTKNRILKSTERHSDNALFYQIIASQYGDENSNRFRGQPDSILRSLIYLDFESVFSSKKKKENKKRKSGYLIDNKSKWSEKDIDSICSILFEFGFSIVFEDGEVKTYIPFDKSGNMSRNYAITFIERDLFPEVDRRLRLDIDFSSIKVVLSKYYSYRGLYLTDGIRMVEDSDHVLNHKTVLVVDDDTHDFMLHGEVQEVPVITADENLLLDGRFESIEKAHPIRLNSFDGEGIVSPFLAEYMNRSRQQEVFMKNLGVSFQIRMPYVKGMLHQVDFHRFFKEQLSDDDFYIKDVFGIPRRIADVQIVLTKSMFKCAGWLTDYTKIHPEIKDPMEWYFDMFHRYSHALYVCNTDSNMGSLKISLTYQFLNTMALTPKNLEKLINRHLNEIHSITKTGAKYAVDMTEYLCESLFEDEDVSSSIPAWKYALDLNPDFVRDPYIRSVLKKDENARVKDICKGRIIIDGSLKYLSGDLLALLIHMIYNKKGENENGIGEEIGLGLLTEEGEVLLNTAFNSDVVARLRGQLIRNGKFYTADHARLKLRKDRRYGVLRSPHLSRNEQCSLRAYIPDDSDGNNIYNRYFSHLKNLIMFPYESIDAMSLGGADYDGDKVKIILDKVVNEAILKGAYHLKGKDFERKLPIVEIPSLGSNREPAPEIIPYRLVKSTFSNQVGLISDLAIKFGKMEYSPLNTDSSFKNKCAECTLATGLEIDAAKTGVRPDLEGLKESSPSRIDYYLLLEDIIKDVKPEDFEKIKVRIDETKENRYGGIVYTAARPRYSKKTKKTQYVDSFFAEFIPLDAPSPLIDRLPGYMLKDLSNEEKNAEPDIDEKTGRSKEFLLFKFQLNEDTGMLDTKWAKKLEEEPEGIEKIDRISALIKAYVKINSDAAYVRKKKKNALQSNNMNKVWFLLTKLFDIETERLPITHTKIPEAIGIVRSDLRNIFETTDEVEEAINRMETLDWIFVSEEEREAVLYQILGTESLLEETKELLLCNEPDAFDFLKFYLYDIKDEIILESTADEKDIKKPKLAKYLTGYSINDHKEFLHEYMEGQKSKEPKSIWNARIIDLCRKKLAEKELFSGDFDRALKYYYACRGVDPGRHFLWEVFKTGEILRNIYIKPKE